MTRKEIENRIKEATSFKGLKYKGGKIVTSIGTVIAFNFTKLTFDVSVCSDTEEEKMLSAFFLWYDEVSNVHGDGNALFIDFKRMCSFITIDW